MKEDTRVIVEYSLAENVIEMLPFLFYEHVSYYEREENIKVKSELKPIIRKTIYKYNNENELNRIVQYADENKIPIATFSRVNGDMRDTFEQFNNNLAMCFLDVTSISYALEGNKNLIYLFEQVLCLYANITVICHTPQVDTVFKFFPLFFCDQEPMSSIIPELQCVGEEQNDDNQIKRIPDLSETAFNEFIEYFNHNLIGHNNFKQHLKKTLKNYVMLNKVGEQRVLSIFLYGSSGIGKTEVARLLADGLKGDSYLPKICFQNYSSQDALNSLIGSPAGYVGCNNGELSDKIQKSKIGVLLCDEFEKTTRPVFSFFLELLEEGRFTDSMAREYDMNGYIIVFTSNIRNESDYKKMIPPELQTRFDLVCEFQEPTILEKKEFLDLLLEKAKKNFEKQFSQIDMTEKDKEVLFAFDYSDLHAHRDIKRIFNERLVEFFNKCGINAFE